MNTDKPTKTAIASQNCVADAHKRKIEAQDELMPQALLDVMRTIPAEKPTAIKTEEPYVGPAEPSVFSHEYDKVKAQAAQLAEALQGMMDAFCRNVEQTVANEGESALQSDVKRARRALAAYEEGK